MKIPLCLLRAGVRVARRAIEPRAPPPGEEVSRHDVCSVVQWMTAIEAPRRLKVVVIDPYAVGCETLCACLIELGCEAAGARSAELAEQIVRLVAVDLAIVDHSPPWFDGLEFVGRLRAIRWIPAIVLGDVAEQPALSDTLTLGRPLSLDDLERGLERLGRRTRLPAGVTARC